MVGAVGRLQFDVLVDRLEREYGVEVSLENLPFHCGRWVTGPEDEIARLAGAYGRRRVEDAEGHPMILFGSEWTLRRTASERTRLRFHDVQPGLESAQSTSPQEAHAGASGTT